MAKRKQRAKVSSGRRLSGLRGLHATNRRRPRLFKQGRTGIEAAFDGSIAGIHI